MANSKIKLKDKEGNLLYPVSKTKLVNLPNGLTFEEYIEKSDETLDNEGNPISRNNLLKQNMNKLLLHEQQLNDLYDLYLDATIDAAYESELIKFIYEDELKNI